MELTKNKHKKGFSLIEVVLAIGIFSLAILALVGLMGPMMQSVGTVSDTNEASGITDRINGWLQTECDETGFDAFYKKYISPADGSVAYEYRIEEETPILAFSSSSVINTIKTKTEGTVFKVLLKKNTSLQDKSAGDMASEAHMVIQVEILSGPARTDPDVATYEEVFTYNTAVLR